MYICVDFDGTVVDHRFPSVGENAPGSIKWLKRFSELRAELILFTMRSNTGPGDEHLNDAVEWFSENSIPLFGINRNPTQDRWTSSPKAYGNIYIDDAAFGCPMIQPEGFNRPCVDWSIVGPAIEKLLLSEI